MDAVLDDGGVPMTHRAVAIDRLVEAGLLTEPEATAYVLREIERTSADEAAASMGIPPAAVDQQLREATNKLEAAAATRSAIADLRSAAQPTECDECGGVLTRPYTETDGAVRCFTCAGAEFVMGGGGGAAGRTGWMEGD